MNPEFRPEMTTGLLGDSLTVGIVLALVFGAVCFYLYSRMSQNEKRVGLLENLLLSLKMSTEASLFGPDMVEPTSSPAPLSSTDVEEVTEENYAEMLKGLGSASASAEVKAPSAPAPAPAAAGAEESVSDEKAAEELLRSLDTRKMDANYESMSLKELQALAKQRGLAGAGQMRKRELIDALKRQGEDAPSAPQPLPTVNEFAGAVAGEVGFDVELTNA
jgi:type IV secretory pathway VirB10-like protein